MNELHDHNLHNYHSVTNCTLNLMQVRQLNADLPQQYSYTVAPQSHSNLRTWSTTTQLSSPVNPPTVFDSYLSSTVLR